jgi:hypothetical protein
VTQVRFTQRVANTPKNTVRNLTADKAAYLVDRGYAAYHVAEAESAPDPTSTVADAIARLEDNGGPVPVPAKIPASEIREWAAGYGLDCPSRGRIPKHIRDAYIHEHYGEA